jgi:exonuclease III
MPRKRSSGCLAPLLLLFIIVGAFSSAGESLGMCGSAEKFHGQQLDPRSSPSGWPRAAEASGGSGRAEPAAAAPASPGRGPSTGPRSTPSSADASPPGDDAPAHDAPAAADRAAPGRLRLVSWNLEWLADEPNHGTNKRALSDYAALAGYAQSVNPDIAVLQEVASERAVSRVFDTSKYRVYVTRETGVQRVALVWKPWVRLRVVDEVEELGLGRLRESPDALVEAGGLTFRLLGVHLKSGCFEDRSRNRDACSALAQQIPVLEQWMQARHAAGEAFVVAGDFNRRFNSRDSVWLDLDDGDPAGFDIDAPTLNLSAACRDGRYRDFIDHIVVSSSLSPRFTRRDFTQWNYRAWDPPRLSDHCPIGIDFKL